MAKMTEGYLQIFVGNSLSIASGKHSLEETLEELQYAINRLSVYDDLSRLDILQAFKCAKFIRNEHGRTDLRSDQCVRMLGGLLKMNMPLNIFTQNIRDALEKIEVMLFNDFKVVPSYEIINLWNTRLQKGKKSRNYEPLEPVKNKQGLYLFFETPAQTQQSQPSSEKASSRTSSASSKVAAPALDNGASLINTVFYVGKTGTDDGHGDCDVFYKSDGGSGRIPHHIVGGENVLFKKAYNRFIAASQGTERQGTKQGNRKSREEPGTAITYNDFVNRYSVLCIAIDKEKLGQKFETLLLWWEAYLILELAPVMNESVEVKLGSADLGQTRAEQTGQTGHIDFKHYWPPSRKFSPLLNSEKAKSEEIRVARTIAHVLQQTVPSVQSNIENTGNTASAEDSDNAVDKHTVSDNNSPLPSSVGLTGLPKSVTEKYVAKLEKIFNVDPPKMPSLRKADALLNDYKKQKGISDADIALFCLHYAECCVNHLDCFGGGPEELYDAAGENFRAAIEYAKKDGDFLGRNVELFKSVAYGFPGTEYLGDWLEEVLPRKATRHSKSGKRK